MILLNTKNVVPITKYNLTKLQKVRVILDAHFFSVPRCSDRKERGAARATLLHRCSAAARRAALAVLLRRLSLCVTIVLTQDKQKRQSL